MKTMAFCIWSGALLFCCAASGKDDIATYKTQANYGMGCRISVILPVSKDGGLGADTKTGNGGMAVNPLPQKWHSKLGALGFGISCKPAEDPDRQVPPVFQIGAKYNQQTKQWEKDLQSWFSGTDLDDPENRKLLDQVTRLVNIEAKNSRGYAQFADDTFGDERFRIRHMNFCLFKDARALCGYGDVAYLGDGKRGDLTLHALKIIQSIEFLPDESSVEPSPTLSK